VSRKKWFVIGSSAGAGLFLLVVLIVTGTPGKKQANASTTSTPTGWNREAITASYVASQLRELDETHSSLLLSYELNNETDADYRLAEGPGVVIMGRLRSDGSLSEEQPARLSYPVFLPARQRARMAIEISRSFSWPLANDRWYEDKLRDFVRQSLAPVQEFVVFDVATRCQIELPEAWQELADSTTGKHLISVANEK
jgi:hypothetical protein